MAILMPSGAVETFTGTANATMVGTNFTLPTNQGTGGHFQTTGTQGRLRTGTAVGNRISAKINRATLADGEMVFDWVVPAVSTMFPQFCMRSGTNLDGDGGYWLAVQTSSMELVKWVPNYNGVSLQTQSYTFTPGTLMRTRIAVFGSRIRSRTWIQANPENTSAWDMDFTDSGTQPTTGFWGFTNASNTSGSKDFFIDNLNLTDTITPTQATLTATGSSTPTGALGKVVAKTFTGSSTPTGALTKIRVVTRVFTGSSTPTGALRKSVVKTLAGSSTPTGVLRKVIQKKFTGSSTPTGAYRKAFVRLFTGSSTPTGTLDATRIGRIFGRPGIVVVTHRIVGEVRARIRRG